MPEWLELLSASTDQAIQWSMPFKEVEMQSRSSMNCEDQSIHGHEDVWDYEDGHIIHRHDGKWFFWGRNWVSSIGPHDTFEEAKEDLFAYAREGGFDGLP